uniref:PABS domain-containing protein n=1 Tax=Anopheles quadriannulatus TaxID=34691 RepID=A0A182X5Q5_ANOQN
MEYLPLGRTGLKVSKVSFGTGTFSQLYGNLDEAKALEAVKHAVQRGINYIDTAPYYGQGRSEEVLGRALRAIPRAAYYVATKVSRYEREYDGMFDYSAQKTRQSVERSLQLLGLDYLDVVQIHDVEFAPNLDIVLNETLPTLEALRAEGKLRFIGVSAYPLAVLREIITKAPGRFDTVLSYCRNTLFDDSLEEYIPFFREHKMGLICASGHGMGLLTNGGPQPWHPADRQLREVCAEAAAYCKREGVELGKLAMHHALQMPGPATFLAGMQTPELVQINLDAYFEGLSEKEADVLGYLKERYKRRRASPAMNPSEWFSEISNELWPGQCFSVKVKQVLHEERSKYQDIKIIQSESHGVVLILDGIIQCTERDEFAYQEMISFLPLCCHPNPQRVLIVGGGDGGVAREVAKHPAVLEVHQVEIDERVVELSKQYLPFMACGFESPKLKLTIGDGFEYMKQHEGAFDVIITDSSDPIGPAESLFRESYFELVKRALKPNGIICSQGGSFWLDAGHVRETLDYCRKHFPRVTYGLAAVPSYPTGQIGFFIASLNPETDFREPARKFEDAEIDQLGLRYYTTDVHRAAFTLPRFAAKALNP